MSCYDNQEEKPHLQWASARLSMDEMDMTTKKINHQMTMERTSRHRHLHLRIHRRGNRKEMDHDCLQDCHKDHRPKMEAIDQDHRTTRPCRTCP